MLPLKIFIREVARFVLIAGLAALGAPALAAEQVDPNRFAGFLQSLWPQAQSVGVTRRTFDSAFKGVRLDPSIVANSDRQAEFIKPIWVYLSSAISPARIQSGQLKFAAFRSWLAKAHITFGADSAIVMGVWGMETEFGAFAGNKYVVAALANLAFARYRGDYFRDELLAALQILQNGDVNTRLMRGSWAGAMGQPQFMPSSYLQYAVDFDGRGRRDIWTSAPDAIGSIGNYFQKHGWSRDFPWGFEVKLPKDFQLASTDFGPGASFESFVQRGVTLSKRQPIPPGTNVRLLMPSGLLGPIFLVTPNFDVIKTYNNSTAYALGVALLGDAILGRGGLEAKWPIHDHFLDMDEVRELQLALKKKDLDAGPIDGIPGSKLEAAVRAYQTSVGLPPDGYPTLSLLREVDKSR